MRLKEIMLFTFAFLITIAGFGQTSSDGGKPKGEHKGTIQGQLIDSKTGETLPGAIVAIDGTTVASITDMDGNFSFRNLSPGTYKLSFRLISYATKVVSDIIVTGKEPVVVSISLEASSSELLEVVVEAKVNRESNVSLIIQQKNNASVSDGISAETIKRTPDRTTSDVLKRVSGTTIQENKFAIIRGLNDRYNFALINGAPLPSSESDRKAFAFDIFPANTLDNIIIVKTGTPDMPGEFAGGIIQLNTKSIPDENKQTVSISGSFNSFTTFKEFQTYKGGKSDWIGVDDGTRALSGSIPTSAGMSSASIDEKARLAKQMNYDWGLFSKTAMPNTNFQYSCARNTTVLGKEFGILGALTYQKNFSTNYTTRKDFEGENGDVIVPKVALKDTSYNENTLSSVLLNFSYKIDQNNLMSFKNLYSINSDDRLTVRAGARDLDQTDKTWERSSARWFTQNIFYSNQLSGDHLVFQNKCKFNWNIAFSNINRTVPALRKNVYQKVAQEESDANIPYVAVIQQNGVSTFGAGNMFFSGSDEQMRSVKYDLSIPSDIEKWNIKNTIKIGAYHQLRDRDFTVRSFGFSKYRKGSSIKFVDSLLLLPDNQIFSEANLGQMNTPAPYNGGFKLEESTKISDNYQASSQLHAGYIMSDTRVSEKIRLVWGARVELYNQVFSYIEFGSNASKHIDTTVIDILPSANIIYSLNEKMNLRFAYYKTVSRPEFRELAPFSFYNFILDNIWNGDPTLKRAEIYNYDFRYEWYPSGVQMVSVSAFYKDFINPIETVNRHAVSGAPELFYTNIPKSINYGAELEYRINLSIFTKNDSNILLSNTSLFSNLAFIKSEVDNKNVAGATTRPLQGQSPYVVNGGVSFVHPKHDFSVSIAYNVVGRRIWIVGNTQEPDIWENPRHVLDFQLTKMFKKKFEIKINARDLLAQNQIFYQDINKNGKTDKNTDNYMIETRYAPTCSVSLSYKF